MSGGVYQAQKVSDTLVYGSGCYTAAISESKLSHLRHGIGEGYRQDNLLKEFHFGSIQSTFHKKLMFYHLFNCLFIILDKLLRDVDSSDIRR
jgi:hypothetical protein